MVFALLSSKNDHSVRHGLCCQHPGLKTWDAPRPLTARLGRSGPEAPKEKRKERRKKRERRGNKGERKQKEMWDYDLPLFVFPFSFLLFSFLSLFLFFFPRRARRGARKKNAREGAEGARLPIGRVSVCSAARLCINGLPPAPLSKILQFPFWGPWFLLAGLLISIIIRVRLEMLFARIPSERLGS